ncbi:alpha/beta fold hydrolase [Inquilinus limosus]|uniref:Alpha/beta hydrolase n=1 Tax=Inquilinus limosus MP06 TaxID=1398085 RepID=A0A0A0D4D8_9PROT|nr:alpha/beta hydrolase [Inquilinus limosus]KGM32880.1 alpha/beta hydrolase [Inquilinus limosus MP06]
MPTIQQLRTSHLDIAFEAAGPADGMPVVLAHGWPDDVRCWDRVTPQLADAGYRVLSPYLRGVGPTRFLSAGTMRSGAIAALGQDLADFIDGLDLRDALVVGYDWGARAGYAVAAAFPQRLRGLVAMSAGYATGQPVREMPYELAKAYWYEWLVATRAGREAMEADRRRLCRYLWESWSPGWRFAEEEFQASAASWDNPDWAPISIHAYLQRWGEATGAPEHEALQDRLSRSPPIGIPTIVLHGARDGDNLPETSAGKDSFFRGGYERTVLEDVGHFVPREAPDAVVAAARSLLPR